jgi:hypothetical protein
MRTMISIEFVSKEYLHEFQFQQPNKVLYSRLAV